MRRVTETEANPRLAALRQELKKPLSQRKSKSTLSRWRREQIMYNLGARDHFPGVPLPQDGDFTEWVKREQGKVTLMRQSWAATAKDTAFYDGARRS